MRCGTEKKAMDDRLPEQRAARTLPYKPSFPPITTYGRGLDAPVARQMRSGSYVANDSREQIRLMVREGDIQPDQFSPALELDLVRGVRQHYQEVFHSPAGKRLLAITENETDSGWVDRMADQQAVNIGVVFTTLRDDIGMGSGGQGGAKVFWQPYSADFCPAHLRSFALDPIYVLSHEIHHAYGFTSEFDELSDAMALDFHLQGGNTLNPDAVDQKIEQAFYQAFRRAKPGRMDWARKRRALIVFLYQRHPEYMRQRLQATFGNWQKAEKTILGWGKHRAS